MSTATVSIACGECGAPMELRNSRFGRFFGCTRYPDCKGTHCAHQATGKPMGVPANAETKAWRHKAHEAFDALWQDRKLMSRGACYRWLTIKLTGQPKPQCHIGEMTIEQCQQVIALCEAFDPLDIVALDATRAEGESKKRKSDKWRRKKARR